MTNKHQSGILKECQEIAYGKNGEIKYRLTSDTVANLIVAHRHNIRYEQPFTGSGEMVMIPLGSRTTETARVTEVKRDGNILVLRTGSSGEYTIEYRGIDLEKVLKDGRDKGINDRSIPVHSISFP